MKNKQLMIAISVVAISLSFKPLNKNETSDNQSAEVIYQEIPVEQKVDQVTTITYRDNLGIVTSDASPKLKDGHAYLSASALFWNILTDAQDASMYTYSQETSSTLTQKNYYQSNKWGWNWGVKAALGYRVCSDGWDLSFNFAYLQSTQRQRNNTMGGKTLYPLSGLLTTLSFNNLYNKAATGQTNFASMRLKNNFNLYDSNIDLAREFFVSKRLSLKPLAGIKGTLIEQKAYTKFTNGTNGAQGGSFTNKNNYWGVGPQAGAGVRFGFTRHISLNCQLDAALLWGQILNRQMLWNYTPSSTPKIFNSSYKANRYQVVPNVNFYAGFMFDTNFSHDTKNIAFNIGYENRYFLNSIDTVNSVTRAKGSTSLQGFSGGFTFSY